ncbi:hypothetical protein PMG11_02497 [Penicillium brasilianum]|uniref:Peptidase metallopeptidase domain-containing protein n=1 Tax=Penicillium brasilianum TaxID=104259 RepID=A0A0F7TI92_PENBI|nr:hypothetical protein PMG11_02497 [Penicillium brasilianum]
MATTTDRYQASGVDNCELLIAFESEHMKGGHVLVEPNKYPHLPKPSKKYLCLTHLDFISDCRFVLHSDTPILHTFDRHGGVLEQLSLHEHRQIRERFKGTPTRTHQQSHTCPDVIPWDSSRPQPEFLDLAVLYRVNASKHNRKNISRELFKNGLVESIMVKSAVHDFWFSWLKPRSILTSSFALLYLKGNVLVSGRHLVGGAALSDLLWDTGSELRVRFLEGSEFVKEKVKFYARIWEKHANIRFVFIDSGPSDIRVAFRKGEGSNSYIGKQSRHIPEDQATMNLGWFDESTPDTEFSRTTLHEFGHALGLVHEHMSPAADIQWNKPAVYQDYMAEPNNWTKEEVDQNVLGKYSPSVTRFTKFDPDSNLCYDICKEHTLNGIATSPNAVLSDLDKEFIGQVYPFKAPANVPT